MLKKEKRMITLGHRYLQLACNFGKEEEEEGQSIQVVGGSEISSRIVMGK